MAASGKIKIEPEAQPDGLTEDEINEMAQLSDVVVEIRNRINELTEQKDAILAQMRERLKPSEQSYAFRGHSVRVSQATTFDQGLAAMIIAPELIPLVTVVSSVIDEDKAREILSPAAFAACRRPKGKATVTVK